MDDALAGAAFTAVLAKTLAATVKYARSCITWRKLLRERWSWRVELLITR